ncbi:hypothetical protein DACRYDRAFT_45292 [Dacryopinax primogenitus]|uniref:Uncharacterized protein n=1 Tax=Dacryopinax primogenitus (strain DJM 731) TaxID=1858805 RepID=M5GCK1_DACPD|nr:uncharacterized protein DACRYDRAFT_45292 [Dacryopinax primogenitus]EJU06260.1 hypothetical protein DACRYDRAFT_45292 [Dacryopinax primogenitus]
MIRLQQIDCLIGDFDTPIACILDGGSGIVGISKKCCEQIGLTYTPVNGWQMESANGSIDQLLRHVPNLCISISGLNFYVQAFILPNLPFHLLLTCPFHILVSCITQDYMDGKQKIQIMCLNFHQTINLWTQSH